MTLGDFIDTLCALPADKHVMFDFGAAPTSLCSWRGVYTQLTIDSRLDAEPPTVGDLLKDAESAVGRKFTGYKGGECVMDRSTPVWADPRGYVYERMLLGVAASGDTVVLKTMVRPLEYGP